MCNISARIALLPTCDPWTSKMKIPRFPVPSDSPGSPRKRKSSLGQLTYTIGSTHNGCISSSAHKLLLEYLPRVHYKGRQRKILQIRAQYNMNLNIPKS